ncbi:MAG: hypothetical protein KIT58_21135, partial [Planctomycetota bacterium]|nr:hypothetical protein [Planctomycetota bacterium]
YRGLPEQLGPAVRRDEVLLAPLSPAQRLALLHALYPGEPWRVGASLPPLRVPGDHATIQSAIDAAAPGQRVQVAAGRVYDEQLRLRPHVQLHGEGASLRHDHRAAILVEDCPGVTVAGFTLLPRHRSLARAPRRPVAGSEERAIVKVVRSAATVSVTVLDPGPCWAVSFLESTGTLGGRLADGAQGGVCVSGPGSHVRIHEASIAMPQGDLVVVTGGALAEVEGGDLSGRGADAGILVLGAGSRVQVDEKGLALVRFEGGAVPDEALARRLAERDRLLGERRRARVAAYVEEKGRTYLDAMRAFMGDDALRREEDERTFLGAPDYRWAHTGRTCAPLLVRLVKDLEATALPGVVEDRARLDALIGEQTRAFLGSHRVVAYAEVVWGVRGERQPGSEAEAASDRARFHEFLDADDADYLEAHKRWRVREARRAQRGRAAGPPDVEPWPTRWERQRIPGTPLSALFPGRQVEMSKREGSREHRHGHVIFVANAGPLPVDAGRPFSREQLERVARNFLDATTQGRGGQVVWEHGLPAPYALGGWRREEVEKNDLTLYRTHAQFILLDRAGRPWRCGLLLLSSFGHLEDEVLRARFFHSLRFE